MAAVKVAVVATMLATAAASASAAAMATAVRPAAARALKAATVVSRLQARLLLTLKIHAVQCGYWNWLRPLPRGDHLLHIHSKSPTYRVDITYQLSVAAAAGRGPE